LKQGKVVVTNAALPHYRSRPLADRLEAGEVVHFVMGAAEAGCGIEALES
jgi:hypothetical protein